MPTLPCLLCGERLDLRVDKNSKPYVICNECGLQLFIRRKPGIHRLDELVRTLRHKDLPFREHALALYEIRAILGEVSGLKEDLEKLESVFNVFSNDGDKKRTRELLRTRIENLFLRLERIAESDGGRQ